jgi:hypothetical protein
VRYSLYFDCSAHAHHIANVITVLIREFQNGADPDTQQKCIYIFYRLSMKISWQLAAYIETTLPVAAQLFATLPPESVDNLIKAFSLILSNKGINE